MFMFILMLFCLFGVFLFLVLIFNEISVWLGSWLIILMILVMVLMENYGDGVVR